MSNALMSIELMICIAAIGLAPGEAGAQDRPDCPGKIVCPLTGDLVCKDRCPLGETEAGLAPRCCATDAPEVSPGMVSQQDQERPISLRSTLEPLIDHFNSGLGKTRFVALVSSTCPACVFGAKAIRESVLKAYPEADIQVSIVWIDMLPSDNEDAAIKSAAIFNDPRVKQFYDPDRKAGYAIAKDLLYENAGPAWDIYLYYDKGAEWTDAPPRPIEYMHQLSGGRRADAARFTPGQKLVESLHKATGRIQQNRPIVAVAPTKIQQPAAVQADTTPIGRVLRIEGMDCQLCANAVQSALGKLDGVTEVGVDFQGGLGWVGFDSPNAVSDGALVEAITSAGYAGSIIENAMVKTESADKSGPDGGIGVEMEVRTVDDFSQPPIQSDWFDEVRRKMRSLTNKDVTNAQTIGADSGVNLQFLSFPSCPNTPKLRERLTAALAELGIDLPIVEVNLMDLEKGDPRLCYGAPTILINGNDLLGQDPTERPGLQCRIYADGALPSLNELLQRLQSCCSVGDDR